MLAAKCILHFDSADIKDGQTNKINCNFDGARAETEIALSVSIDHLLKQTKTDPLEV